MCLILKIKSEERNNNNNNNRWELLWNLEGKIRDWWCSIVVDCVSEEEDDSQAKRMQRSRAIKCDGHNWGTKGMYVILILGLLFFFSINFCLIDCFLLILDCLGLLSGLVFFLLLYWLIVFIFTLCFWRMFGKSWFLLIRLWFRWCFFVGKGH